MAKKKETFEEKYLRVKGTLITRTLTRKTRGQHPKDTRECYRWAIKYPMVKEGGDDVSTLIDCFGDRTGDQYCPKWIKDVITEESFADIEYINFKSQYPLFVKEYETSTEFNPENVISGAEGYFIIKLKPDNDGEYSAYCSKFIMTANGVSHDTDGCDF